MKKRLSTLSTLFMISALAWLVPASFSQDRVADVVLYNGKVLTVATDQGNFPIAEAVAVGNGRVLAVGSNQSVLNLAGPQTRKVDLKGKAVMPGLINSHIHPQREALLDYNQFLPLQYRKSVKATGMIFDWRNKADVLRAIEGIATSADPEPEMVTVSGRPMMGASGWGASVLALATTPGLGEGRGILIHEFPLLKLTVEELDKVSAGRPVAIMLDGVALANTKAKEMIAKRRDSKGRVLGGDYNVTPEIPAEYLAPLYKLELQDQLAPLGFTTVSSQFRPLDLDTYAILEQKQEMPLRVAYALGAESALSKPFSEEKLDQLVQSVKTIQGKYNSDYLWFNGIAWGTPDGSPDGGSICASFSRMSDITKDFNFKADGCRTNWNDPNDPLPQVVRRLNRLGYRFSNMHTWGNLAVEQALEFYETIDKENPIKGRRFAFDHAGILSPKVIQLASQLGVMFSVASFSAIGGQRALLERQVFGSEMVDAWAAPVKKLLDGGVRVAFETEFLSKDPWKNLQVMVTRIDDTGKIRGSQNAVDRNTALRMMTRWSADYVQREKQIGSIEPGKLADLIVVDKNPLDPNLPDDMLSTIRVMLTMVGGKVVYRATNFEM